MTDNVTYEECWTRYQIQLINKSSPRPLTLLVPSEAGPYSHADIITNYRITFIWLWQQDNLKIFSYFPISPSSHLNPHWSLISSLHTVLGHPLVGSAAAASSLTLNGNCCSVRTLDSGHNQPRTLIGEHRENISQAGKNIYKSTDSWHNQIWDTQRIKILNQELLRIKWQVRYKSFFKIQTNPKWLENNNCMRLCIGSI